nr:hypothetical protein [Tanacetum cinerariifolium]
TTIPDTTPLIAPPTTDAPIIEPTIPPSSDYTPASPDYSPASEAESEPSEDPSSGHIPPLPAISPFLSSDDDTTDSDTPYTPPSPTHDTPFTEITASNVETTKGIQREQGRRIVGVESAVIALTERIAELERDNQRLRGIASVESQRVDRLQRGMSRIQREMRQMR